MQDINIRKCLGPVLSIKSESGKVLVDSLYSEKSSINSSTADIQIKNCHKDCSISTKEGSIQIGRLYDVTLFIVSRENNK